MTTHFLNVQPPSPQERTPSPDPHHLKIVNNEQHGLPRHRGHFVLAEPHYIWSDHQRLLTSATSSPLHGMAISGAQLAEILKSFGASPEDIATAAAELSQSVTSATTASANTVSAAPSTRPSQPSQSVTSTSSDTVSYPPHPTQGLPTSSQPVGPPLVAPSSLPSAALFHPTASSQSGTHGPAPTPANQQSTQAAPPHPVVAPPITASSLPPSFLPRASGAAEYFETGPRGPSMQPVRPSAMHGLQQLALSSLGNGASLGLMASPIQAAPLPPSWDIQAPRSSQWGATGVTTAPQPGTLPGALASMFALGPTGSRLAPQTPHAPLITSSTPVPKPPRRKSSSTKAKVAPRKPIAQKTVYLVPRNGITRLTAKIKAACDFASLLASPKLWVDMSSGEVREALQAPFKHIIDFKEHSYELFAILGQHSAQHHQIFLTAPSSVIFTKRGRLPNYDEGIRLYEKTHKKRGEDDEGESDEVVESEEEEEELFVCPSCHGTFDPQDADAHEVKCPARRKRRLSANKSTHTRHQSVPTILSPERKRLRKSREASSDGEADARGTVGRR
ncbi:hypothetical protein M407DRAFT_31161 [Tulasnella calospora MUT 4182]|uniref:Uncharacterized protein n=1 Tax=Tulasnella calospora MUT 4182 TaxID=1051891 RepID=A0A0C3KCK6_9AGAM|nr:hypothetical protein M407DRAFT_31161 [Tulasnella calospora MUT 4182]